MSQMPYRAKSVSICNLKRTENIVPEIYFMPFSFFVESDETRMMRLPDSKTVLI